MWVLGQVVPTAGMPRCSFVVSVYHHENAHDYEICDEAYNRAVKAHDISTSYAFAEEHTMVVVV